MPRPLRSVRCSVVLALSVVVVLSSASPTWGLGSRPDHRGNLASARRHLGALQGELDAFDMPIRVGTAVWLAMQVRVKAIQARLQHDRRLLRSGPGRAAARRLRVDLRRGERHLAPLLPAWIRTKAVLKRAYDGVKAALLRVRRLVAFALGPVPGRRSPARWQAVFRRPRRSSRGRIDVCPVDGPYFMVDTFGAPRPGGRFHEGVDLQAARGTPLVAALPGVVRRVPNTLGGDAVIVDSAGGTYLYYAHLSAYGSVGRVAAGTVVGYVGASGDARGLIPHLHFELHPGGGDAVDAFPDLQAVC